jgi:hypothetical protein
MTRHQLFRGASRRSFLVVLAFLLLAGLLSLSPAASHTFTRNDANDSASRIDLRSVSVSHTSTSVVHSIRTWNSWTPASLQHDSFFLIGINKDNDAAYERCAFIYYTTRLRGQLSNCGSQFIRYLTVSKVNATTAKITVPKSQLGPAYEWYGGSFWVGARPCRNVCRDFAPNTLPDILHDLTLPVINMNNDFLAVWIESTTPDFVLPFTVTDAHTGVDWTLQSRVFGTATWTTVSSGTTEGLHEPSFTDVAAGDYEYRVIVTDDQGNHRDGPIREVVVPIDVDLATGPGAFVGGVDTADVTAYGGSYVALDERDDTYTIVYDHPGGPCRNFFVVGSGFGTWQVRVTDEVGDQVGVADGSFVQDLPRATVYGESLCADATRVFTVNTDVAGFRVDAVVI